MNLHTLPTQFMSVPVTIKGYVATIPNIKNNNISFVFLTHDLFHSTLSIPIQLTWYRTKEKLKVGDKWQFEVKLKPLDYINNNYSTYLFENGIRAIGYVTPKNNILIKHDYFFHSVDQIRQHISDFIDLKLGGKPLVGFISALSIGVRGEITEDQWQVLRNTGTNHLFVIGGLHVGFITGLIYFFIKLLWRCSERLSLRVPDSEAAAFFSLIVAFLYTVLGGFALPSVRALVMLSVFLWATLLKRNIAFMQGYALALLIVLIIEPLSVFSSSFWLSFAAVGFIIYGMLGRINGAHWKKWLRIQFLLSIALLPFGLFFFQSSSLLGFAANALAIPVVGFLVLPLCLLGDLFYFLIPSLSIFCFEGAEKILAILWQALSFLSEQPYGQWQMSLNGNWKILLSATLGTLLYLAPRGFPGRYWGVVGCLPLFLWSPPRPQVNDVWLNVLSTGKTIAAVVQTRHHVLLYNVGRAASVLSYLREQHISNIDVFVFNNTRSSNINEVALILQVVPVKKIYTSQKNLFTQNSASTFSELHTQNSASTFSELQWNWDGIIFNMENTGCLRVDAEKGKILLLGEGTAKNLTTFILPEEMQKKGKCGSLRASL